ncbi:fatty acid synthase alpha subunit Lsd1 [Blastocladiella emersonii ATCC 22665]|nr:fatty acid synthase alpha subunit Lsd1 [Blastocladiella emersonii ATCC 22665]
MHGPQLSPPPPPPLPPPLPPPQQQPQQHSQLEQQLQQDVVMQDLPKNDSQDGVGSAEDAGTVTNLNGDVVMEDANAETVTNGAPTPVAETTSAAPATTMLAYSAKLPIGKHRVPGTTPPVPIGHEPIPRAIQQSPTLTDAPWDPFPDFVSWRFTFFCMVEAALSDCEIDALINLINLIAAIVIVNKFGNLNMFPDRLLVKLPKGIVQRKLVKKSAFYRKFKCSVLTDSDGNKYNFITLSVVPSLLRGSRCGVTLDWLGNKFPNLLRGLTKAMAKHVLLDIDNRDANAALRPKDLTDAASRVSQVCGFQCTEIHCTSDLDRQPIVEILKARVTESHGRLVNDFFVARCGNQGGLNIMEPILFLDFAVKGFDNRFQVAIGRWFSRFKPNSNTMLARDAITHLIQVRCKDGLAVVPVPAIVSPVHLVPMFLKHLVNGKPKKKPRPSTANVLVSVSGPKRIFELPTDAAKLPAAMTWLATLVAGNGAPNWLRALVLAQHVVQGRMLANNYVPRLLAPRASMTVAVTPTKLALTLHDARTPGLVIRRGAGNKITLTLTHAYVNHAASLDLVFRYSPETPYALIHKKLDGRNARVKAFYVALWATEVVAGEARKCTSSHVVNCNSIARFCKVVQNDAEQFVDCGWDQLTAPLDYAIVAGWQAVVQPLFLGLIDRDLLKLVHLSNSFKVLVPGLLVYAGDKIETQAKVISMTNTPTAKKITVKDTLARDGTALVKVTLAFFVRGAFNNYHRTFNNVDKEPISLTVRRPQDCAVLESKEYISFDAASPVPIAVGSTLMFRLGLH